MSAWDGLTATALIFTATVTPFEVAFLETAESTNDALFVINRLLDVIFTLDMLSQFFLMYKIGEEGASVRRRRAARRSGAGTRPRRGRMTWSASLRDRLRA